MPVKKTAKVLVKDDYTPPAFLRCVSDNSELQYINFIIPADSGIKVYQYEYVVSSTKKDTTLGMPKTQLLESLRKGTFIEYEPIKSNSHADTVPELQTLF